MGSRRMIFWLRFCHLYPIFVKRPSAAVWSNVVFTIFRNIWGCVRCFHKQIIWCLIHSTSSSYHLLLHFPFSRSLKNIEWRKSPIENTIANLRSKWGCSVGKQWSFDYPQRNWRYWAEWKHKALQIQPAQQKVDHWDLRGIWLGLQWKSLRIQWRDAGS